jgi:hypothetical protein
MHGRDKNAYKILVAKPEGKRQLGRIKLRWIERCEGIALIHVAQDRPVFEAVICSA